MKKITNLSNILILLILSLSCTENRNVPISLDHAECLTEFYFHNTISINDCEHDWNWEINDGWNTCEEEGISYKIEYSKSNLYLINMIDITPGAATNQNLFLIEIKNDTYKLIEYIAGGDRCSGSIISEDVKNKDNIIYYSQRITPFKLMSWTGLDLHFDSYPDCMNCCCGVAKYRYNPASKEKEFIGIELGGEEMIGYSAFKTYLIGNSAFSKTYNEFIKRDTKTLNEKDIIEFINKVEDTLVALHNKTYNQLGNAEHNFKQIGSSSIFKNQQKIIDYE